MALHKIPSCYSVKYSHKSSGVILENHFHWTQSDAASINATWIYVTQGESFTSVLCGNISEFSDESMFQLVFVRKWNRALSPKDKRDQPDFHQRSWYWGALLQTVWVTCIIVKVLLTWRHIFCIVQRHKHQDDIFPGKQNNARPHFACTSEWFLDTLHHRRDVLVCLLKSRYVS